MKRFWVYIFCICLATGAQAQIHEIGVFMGGSNFIGDVGATDYIKPKEPAYGIMYRWNKSPRHSWRFSYIQSNLAADDADSEIEARQERNYHFNNLVREFSAGLEFDFFNFDMHDSKPQATPYVHTGLSYIMYDGLYFDNGKDKSYGSRSSFAIPMTVGFKGRIFDIFVLGFEVGARATFRDDIDGSNPSGTKYKAAKFGNLTSKDWYTFTGFTLTYTFGDRPCFCAQ
ncbi:hypothetical protein KIH23_08735 [Flavobacterium sp. CYK-55]|uniref:type IX secretion system protein PorG n=1 Tax=Flavobacterium sp. CYK-55 TaxID=2835529 RepID=UPI001BCEDEAB|nr:DUF6089 family protein [Flavobacterium sp. CYK-55]MBS7787381.1 hypothetical protein [Flavobacterium sp. CYK-55]